MVLAWARGPYLADLDRRIRIIDLNLKSKVLIFPSLAMYLYREKPDVLSSAMDIFNIAALVASRISRSGVRVAISCHVNLSTHSKFGGKWHDRALPWLARLLYPGADQIIAVSRGVGEDLESLLNLPKSRISVIHNPISVADIRARSAHPIKHPWLGMRGVPVLLAVGRLLPQKDYPTLFRAVAEIRRSRDVRLIVLGEGPERPNLERLADQLGISDILSMPGFVENPFAYMRRAQLLVLSSRWEGFALVLAEALACGCPVVSTDCPSGPSEILEGGRFGMLTPVGDDQQLARAIEASLSSPTDPRRLEMRANLFNVDRIAGLYLEKLGINDRP